MGNVIADILSICLCSTVNLAYNDTRRGIKKVSLFAKCPYTRSLIVCIQSGMGLCSGHGNSVVIRELSLYPQSVLAKLTVQCTYDGYLLVWSPV